MNNRNFSTISDLKEYINENMKLSSEFLFYNYLSKIYTNLLQREENPSPKKSKGFSRDKNSFIFFQKENNNNINLSLNIFLDYLDIQEYIGERIFKILNKSKKNNKLSKEDFCKGLNTLYYGNIKELINFTFNLSDYNGDGKIYSYDMKLLLEYIPCSSEFSQKNYLKQINKIISKFFENMNINNTTNKSNLNQINLEIYQTFIEEYTIKLEKENEINSEFLYDYEYNAPFFYFISIVSYLFKNLPFNPKIVELFNNSQKKIQKIKLGVNNNGNIINNNRISGYQSMRSQKLLSTENKKNLNNYTNNSIYKNITNNKINTAFKLSANIVGTNRFSYNPNDKMIKEALPKIGRTNLFNIKKSSSQIFLKKELLQKDILNITLNNKNRNKNNKRTSSINNKHEYIISKRKENQSNKEINKDFSLLLNSQAEINFIKRYQNQKKKTQSSNNNNNQRDSVSYSTTKNSSLLLNQSMTLKKIFLTPELFLHKSNSNQDPKEKFLNLKKKLPLLSLSQKKCSPLIGINKYLKLKNEMENGIEEPEEFVLCEYSENDGSSNRNSLIGRDSNKSENIFQLVEAYLYKYDDNNNLIKCYAWIKEKEIIFFTSEQKNEIIDLWYINKSYITVGKEIISKNNYFCINITFDNNFVKKLFFLSENICQSFSLSIKNVINDFNFYDYYELLNEVGQGHFGKVYKCKNKKSGEYFAAKIISKTKLSSSDLDLVRQEKNYLKLIKHENIISLSDFFEDKLNIYFITEFYEGGDILSYLEEKQKEKEKISEKNCARIIRKIGQGIQYLNNFGIIHRDIKPENIMFGRACNMKTIKLIDLGVCKTLSFGEKAKEPIGTNGYISPEIYLHSPYSFKIDIWSLGVILYLLVTGGTLPFEDINMDCKIIAQKVVNLNPEYPEEFFGDKSKKLVELLEQMLEKNDNKRIDIDGFLKNSWFDIIKKEK